MDVQVDVANAADVDLLFKEAEHSFGGINVVVNCAGIMPLSLGIIGTMHVVLCFSKKNAEINYGHRNKGSKHLDERMQNKQG